MALVIVVAAIAIWYGPFSGRPGNPNEALRAAGKNVNLRPAMIVLPFNNLSKDPEQDYFSDGITEDLTTALARIPGFLVTARNTAFTFKGKSVDARKLGTELGVRYVLEGSARKHGDRLRLNAQLIETATGTHVWAETFDRPMKDIFVVQDELANRIVGSVASRLRRREGQRALSASSETLAAYDLMSRARLLFRQNKLEAVTEARELLRRAVDLDPGFAMAYSRLSQVENFFFTNRLSDEYARPETAKRVVEAAARASALAPEDASAHAVHGMALRLTGQFEEATREAKRARKLAPNDPDVLVEVGSVLIGVGAYKDTVETVKLAWALDPYINPVFVGGHLSQALFALGDFKGAKEAALSCLKRAPRDVRCHESLVRALGELGPAEETRQAVTNILKLSPNYTVSEYLRKAKRNRQDKEAITRWADGLRKAGIPE
jgi:adenylate cyclase